MSSQINPTSWNSFLLTIISSSVMPKKRVGGYCFYLCYSSSSYRPNARAFSLSCWRNNSGVILSMNSYNLSVAYISSLLSGLSSIFSYSACCRLILVVLIWSKFDMLTSSCFASLLSRSFSSARSSYSFLYWVTWWAFISSSLAKSSMFLESKRNLPFLKVAWCVWRARLSNNLFLTMLSKAVSSRISLS